ncbi:MAG: DUF4384 domain-containing protein, partial [Verrucomicrobiota bacterium]
RPVDNGAFLRSGPIDQYAALVETLTPGYLYVFQVDSAGRTAWLYPANSSCEYSSGSNPLKAGARVQLPSRNEDQGYYLDENPGMENLFFVFSSTPWPALEDALLKNSNCGQDGSKVTLRSLEVTRGVGGVVKSPGWYQLEFGSATHEAAVEEVVTASSWFVVVHKWFHHVDVDP